LPKRTQTPARPPTRPTKRCCSAVPCNGVRVVGLTPVRGPGDNSLHPGHLAWLGAEGDQGRGADQGRAGDAAPRTDKMGVDSHYFMLLKRQQAQALPPISSTRRARRHSCAGADREGRLSLSRNFCSRGSSSGFGLLVYGRRARDQTRASSTWSVKGFGDDGPPTRTSSPLT